MLKWSFDPFYCRKPQTITNKSKQILIYTQSKDNHIESFKPKTGFFAKLHNFVLQQDDFLSIICKQKLRQPKFLRIFHFSFHITTQHYHVRFIQIPQQLL